VGGRNEVEEDDETGVEGAGADVDVMRARSANASVLRDTGVLLNSRLETGVSAERNIACFCER